MLACTAVFTDGSRGLYTAPLVENVLITSLAISGGDVQLNFTAPASHNFSIPGTTGLTQFGTNVFSGAMGTGGAGACVVPGGFSPFHQGVFYTVKWSGTDPGGLPFNGGVGN